MPDIDAIPNNITNRCFHCGQTFDQFIALQQHLETHRNGKLRPSPPINFE